MRLALSGLFFVEPDGIIVVKMVFADVVQLVLQSLGLKLRRLGGVDVDIKCAVVVRDRDCSDGSGQLNHADKNVTAHGHLLMSYAVPQ